MHMGKVLGVSLWAVVLVAGGADAGVRPIIDPRVSVGSGLSSFTVRFVADTADDRIAGWDGGIVGPTYQLLLYGISPTTTLDTASLLMPSQSQVDTHFLLWNKDIAVRRPLSESSIGLNGAFDILPAARSLDMPFAQFVIPGTQDTHINGTMTTAAGQQRTVRGTLSGPFSLAFTCDALDTDGDGRLEVQAGQPIHFNGSWGDDDIGDFRFITSRIYSYPDGLTTIGTIGTSPDADFTFVQNEPGKYAVSLSPYMIVGGLIPSAQVSIDVVPEPATLCLLTAGCAAIVRRRR